jgi:hypothetical protein
MPRISSLIITRGTVWMRPIVSGTFALWFADALPQHLLHSIAHTLLDSAVTTDVAHLADDVSVGFERIFHS